MKNSNPKLKRARTLSYIALYAIYTALIAALTFIPYIGYITFGPVSMTTLIIPVLVFSYLAGWYHGWAFGLIFGLSSMLKAMTSPTGAFDAFFANPLYSVVPRVMFGALAGVLMELIKKVPNLKIKIVLVVVASIFCTLFHSVITLGLIGALNFDVLNEATLESGGFWVAMSTTMLLNVLPEMALAGVTVCPIALALEKPYNLYVLRN